MICMRYSLVEQSIFMTCTRASRMSERLNENNRISWLESITFAITTHQWLGSWSLGYVWGFQKETLLEDKIA